MIFKYLGLSMRHGSLICGKDGAFAPMWSKFRCTRTSTLGQQMLQLWHQDPNTGTHYCLDCHYAKWDRQICSNCSVITICAQDSLVHQRIQGVSGCLIKHCLFANRICPLKQTWRYWLPVSGYSCHSQSICRPMIDVLVHRRILGIPS